MNTSEKIEHYKSNVQYVAKKFFNENQYVTILVNANPVLTNSTNMRRIVGRDDRYCAYVLSDTSLENKQKSIKHRLDILNEFSEIFKLANVQLQDLENILTNTHLTYDLSSNLYDSKWYRKNDFIWPMAVLNQLLPSYPLLSELIK